MNAVLPACLPLAQWLHSAVQGSRPPAALQTLSEELLSRRLVTLHVLPQLQEFALRFCFAFCCYLIVFFTLTILRFL